ncbi:hypothetical protein [Actinocrispum sp. NPDC049592]|uniref:hypothetical protein n=1 Tax=Actinocrispum sp. NPDC049592 TaxID=3154835 RepID=UPI00341A28CB
MGAGLCDTGGGVAVITGAESLLAAGIQAQEVEGDLLASRRLFDAAYGEGVRTGDGPAMARAALGFAGLWVHEHRTAAASGLVRERLQQSLKVLDPASALAVRVRVRLAAEADYRTGEHATTLAALRQARASADLDARLEALSLAHQCMLGPEHAGQRRALADELVGAGVNGARRTELLMGLLWQVTDLFLDADRQAERRLRELRAMLAERDHQAIGFVVDAIDVMLAIRAGRLTHAEQLARDCFERGAQAGHADSAAWYGTQLVAIRWYQGRVAELLPMLTELVDAPTISAVDDSFQAMLAVAAATAGDHPTAERLLARLRGRGLSELPRSGSWLVTMCAIVETAHLLSNAKAAARCYELLAPFADLPVMAGPGVACFGSVHHALGVASLTMGETDRAVAHLREAVHRDLALGHWPAVLVSRRRYAQALMYRSGPDDEAAALEQRAQAERLASALGDTVNIGAAAPNSARPASMTRSGSRWRVEWGARAVLVDHSVGMLHLAVLTANPGTEIAAIELVAGLDAVARVVSTASVQPVLDPEAVQRYRRRLAELRDDTTASARREREWVLAELSAATGLGGRLRTFTDGQERARLAVGKAIRRSLSRIEQADPTVGAHLRTAIHTGVRCWYRPS